jgi:SAM-dependent methyltransferase
MPFEPDRTGWYLQGIRRAEQNGLIEYARDDADWSVASDAYGHIGHEEGVPLLLKYTNTRPFPVVARRLLDLYSNSTDVRVLELGPGAGVACAAMNRLLPGAKIDTVSLTPLNPYLIFCRDSVHDRIKQPSLHEKGLLDLYAARASPFLHNQYIGRFPTEVRLPRADYHFIYDNYGAIFHNFHENTNAPIELAQASIAAALSLLRGDGTMLIMASDGFYRLEELLQAAGTDTDVIVICKRSTGWDPCPCIVAKKDSPLSTRLREDESGLLPKSERVFRLEQQEFEKTISHICA